MRTTSQKRLITRSPVSKGNSLPTVSSDLPKSIWSLAPLLIGFTLYSGTLTIGGLVGPSFDFWPDSIGSIATGNIILAVYATALGYIAAKSGLNTVLMARFSFGEVGSRWVDFILGFTQIAWYAWGSAVIADLLNKSIGVPFYLHWLTILICTYLFSGIAYISYRFMDWLSRIAVSITLFLMLWSLILGMSKVGGWQVFWLIQPSQALGWSEILTAIVGTFISGGTQVSKWSRITINNRNNITSILVAFFLLSGFLILCGALSSLVYDNEDIVQMMGQEKLFIWGLLLLSINIWTSQDRRISTFSVTASQLFGIKERTILILVGAIVAIILGWGGVYKIFLPYLVFQGAFIPPIGGIIMSDYWLHRKGKFPSLDKKQPEFNWVGILTYFMASAIAYFSPGIKPINGILAAIVIYFILSEIIPFISNRLKSA